MREFHVLAYDTRRADLENVCRYDVGDFYAGTFAQCRTFESPIPSNVKLWVEKGAPTDILANPLDWLILSEKLIAIIQTFAAADVQLVPVPLFHVDSKEPVKGYRLVNILRSLAAIDVEHSVTSEMTILGKSILNVIKPALRHEAIPEGAHIFRPKESPFKIMISDELALAMAGNVVGVAFIRTKTV